MIIPIYTHIMRRCLVRRQGYQHPTNGYTHNATKPNWNFYVEAEFSRVISPTALGIGMSFIFSGGLAVGALINYYRTQLQHQHEQHTAILAALGALKEAQQRPQHNNGMHLLHNDTSGQSCQQRAAICSDCCRNNNTNHNSNNNKTNTSNNVDGSLRPKTISSNEIETCVKSADVETAAEVAL